MSHKLEYPYKVNGEALYRAIYADFKKSGDERNFIKFIKANYSISKQTLDRIQQRDLIESKRTFDKLRTKSNLKDLLADHL